MCDLKTISEKQNVDSYHSDFKYDLLLNDDNFLKFLSLLKDWLNKVKDDDPELYIIEMTQILIDEFSKCCLKKSEKRIKTTTHGLIWKSKKWWNQNLLHKKWVQTPSIENRNNFTSCRNNVIKAIRVSKRRYYDNLITRKKNSSGIFDAVKHFCGKKNVNTALFDIDVFNEHFATIGEKVTQNFKQNVYRSFFPVNKNTFVINDIKLLQNFLHPVYKIPLYITERLTQRDSELLDYSRGLGMYTVTYNCAPQVFLSKADGGFQRHNLVGIKDADQIFKKKNSMMPRQANNARKQNPRRYKIKKPTFLALLLFQWGNVTEK